MTSPFNRRQFVKRTALAASALAFPFVSVRNVLGANQKLNIACIGAGGKGAVDVGYCSGENIVALCDVDEKQSLSAFKKHSEAHWYKDFRKMLDKEDRHIDAVTVSTPDHLHAVQALQAMGMGKHVYCQKPLAHSIYEVRLMVESAQKNKVVTQMGNQGHANSDTRRLIELIQANVLGNVREIHVWTDRPIWPQGMERPIEIKPIPSTLDWDLWLGPAPYRPYHPAYVPFKWRGWWDFGTGALGDMACHNLNLAFSALGLRDPITVEATSSGVSNETAPKWSIITFEFPRRDGVGPVRVVWYDGGKQPSPDLIGKTALPKNGYVLIGEKDSLYVADSAGKGTFISGAKVEDFKEIPETLPRWPEGSKDFDLAHHQEWIEACKGGTKTLSNFNYAGPMTEAILLGNVALRVGKKIEWDAKGMKVTNAPEASRFIKPEFRSGWDVSI